MLISYSYYENADCHDFEFDFEGERFTITRKSNGSITVDADDVDFEVIKTAVELVKGGVFKL